MPYPIVMLVGEAGSGKDAAAQSIAKDYKGTIIALADPFKRLAHHLLKVDSLVLWGPSELRATELIVSELDNNWDHGTLTYLPAKMQKMFGLNTMDRVDAMAKALGEVYAQKTITCRKLIQLLGTAVRDVEPDVWINYALDTAEYILEAGGEVRYNPIHGTVIGEGTPDASTYDGGPNMIIFPDGRRRNEILGVHGVNGKVIKIQKTSQDEVKGGIPGHPSELEQRLIPEHFYDGIVVNTKQGLPQFQLAIDRVMKRLYSTELETVY